MIELPGILHRVLLVAHRAPPTAEGCADLARAGASLFECDVQLRGDVVMVSHYLPFLNIRGWLQHDNAHFRWRAGPPYDATLAEVLSRVPAECGILLDPKGKDPVRRRLLTDALAAELAGGPDGPDRFQVSTSDEDELARYRAAGFRTWRTLTSPAQVEAATSGRRMAHECVSVRHSALDRAAVERLHGVVDTIVAWTVNDLGRARELTAMGVDGITTDRLPVIRALAGAGPSTA